MAEPTLAVGRRRFVAAPLLVVGALVLAACSSGTAASRGTGASSVATSTASVATEQLAASTPKAAATRDHVIAATRALHSYSFQSSSSLGGTTIRVVGRATMPDRVASHIVRTGGTQDTVRVRNALFVRAGAGSWVRSPKAATSSSPLAALVNALTASRALTVNGSSLSGSVTAADAARLGLLKANGVAGPLQATFVLDARDRVVRSTLTGSLHTTGKDVTFVETTTYGDFDQAAPISTP
jgi:hypothetical protein